LQCPENNAEGFPVIIGRKKAVLLGVTDHLKKTVRYRAPLLVFPPDPSIAVTSIEGCNI
jgi:hypothetical protein